MNWKMFFRTFMRTFIISVFFATVGLAVIGYLLAGTEGMKNGAAWGLILGVFGGLMSASTMIYAFYWGDVAGKGGKAWVDDETTGTDSFHKRH